MRRVSVVTTRRGNARRTIWKHQGCRRRGGRGGVSCQASPRRPMDARWRSHDLGEGEGLKGCAARTGRPALALDPPHPHPSVWLTCRFATDVSARPRVSCLLCARSDISILRRHSVDARARPQTRTRVARHRSGNLPCIKSQPQRIRSAECRRPMDVKLSSEAGFLGRVAIPCIPMVAGRSPSRADIRPRRFRQARGRST